MKQKKPVYKKWWFWVIIALVFLALVSGNKKESAPEASHEESQEQTSDSTEGKITAIIDSLKFKYSDLKVYDNGNSVKISLHYDDSSWDETHLCSNCLTDYINLCAQGYEIEGIEKIEYYVFVTFQDAKGNETSEKGFAICMPKKNYNTYTWKNMEYKENSFSQIEADCDLLDIHAGIKKNVDINKVYYKG